MNRLALALIGLVLTSGTALAARPKKVAVMDMPPDKNFSPNATKVLNSFLAGAVRDQGFSVISSADVAAALGHERERQLLGCSESSCLAEIGGALGVDYLVHGEMAVLESNTAVTLSLIDPGGRALNQVREIVQGKSSEALLAAIERLVPKLMSPVKPKPDLAATPAPAPTPAGGLTAQPASEGSGHAAAYTLLGVGAAGLVTSGVFGLLAKNQQSTVNDDAAHARPVDAAALKRDATISTVALGVGVLGAGIGATLLLLDPAPASTAQARRPAPSPLALAF